MSFRLSDFWRWKAAVLSDYNDLIAAIAAWRPDEVEANSVLRRHLSNPPSFVLTDYNNAPETSTPGDAVCAVRFEAAVPANVRITATGFFWPHGPGWVPGTATPTGPDMEMKITTRDGGVWDHSYSSPEHVRPYPGVTSALFTPHGGGGTPSRVWYGGGHVMTSTHVVKNYTATADRIGLFTPKYPGHAALIVMIEDNE